MASEFLRIDGSAQKYGPPRLDDSKSLFWQWDTQECLCFTCSCALFSLSNAFSLSMRFPQCLLLSR